MANNSRFAAWCVAFAVAGCQPTATTTSPDASREAEAAPLPSDAGLERLDEGQGSLAELVAGKVAVIDLWATWCEPCRDTIPKVVRLQAGYAQTDLVVVGIHVGDGADGAVAFASEASMTYPQFADRNFAFSDRVGSRSVPTLLVVDRTGTIVYRATELNSYVLALVRELLAS